MHTEWARRPLAKTYQDYAAQDIVLIAELYNKFLSQHYIREDKLLAQSSRYIALNRGDQPGKIDGHPLLPLNILDPVTYGKHLVCNHCSRSLPADCFSKAAATAGARRNCWVCRAVRVRNNLHRKWEEEEEMYFSESGSEKGGYSD